MIIRMLLFTILSLLITTHGFAQNAMELSLHDRITTRDYPSVFQAWNGADNLPGEDRMVTLARHDLYFSDVYSFGLDPDHGYQGLATTFKPYSIKRGLKFREDLLALNPNMVMIVEIRYRDAHDSFLPPDHEWWKRDESGAREIGWEEGQYYLLDFSNPEYQEHIAQQSKNAIRSGVVDGIMLDWWIDNDDRIALIKKVRKAIGEDALILVNSNDRQIPRSAPYVNGLFMECYKSETPEHWQQITETLRWAESNLRQPRINCLEFWYQESRQDLHLMRATTTLSLTASDGYTLFSDPNTLPSPDHLHDWYPFWDTDLGVPVSEGKVLLGGTIQRVFSNGVAVHNPLGNEAIMVTLDEPMTSVVTGIRSKTHTVPAPDGDILLRDE